MAIEIELNEDQERRIWEAVLIELKRQYDDESLDWIGIEYTPNNTIKIDGFVSIKPLAKVIIEAFNGD